MRDAQDKACSPHCLCKDERAARQRAHCPKDKLSFCARVASMESRDLDVGGDWQGLGQGAGAQVSQQGSKRMLTLLVWHTEREDWNIRSKSVFHHVGNF
jgi:hypothetical protein